MFAALGQITFQALNSPRELREQFKYTFAKHDVVEDRPRLQWLANDLETIHLEMLLHPQLGNPATAWAQLKAAAEAHRAMALVFGNGEHLGYFVITAIEKNPLWLADDGSLIAIEVSADLTEYAFGAEVDPQGPPKPAGPPIAISPAPPGSLSGAGPVGFTTGLDSNGNLTIVGPNGQIIKTIPAPGVSAISTNPASPSTAAPNPDDVPTSVITRAGA